MKKEKRKYPNKKGIIFFDMDDTLLQLHPHCQNGIVINRDDYIIDFVEDDEDISKNITYGIDKRLLRYLETLKEDYILATNTCWTIEDQKQLFDKTEFRYLFDYYCCGLYMHLYDNESRFDVQSFFINDATSNMAKYKDVKGLSHKVNEYFRFVYGDDFKIIQFEDIYNGSQHHNVSFTVGCLNIDDSDIPPEGVLKQVQEEITDIKKESEKYTSGDNRIIYSKQFNDFTDEIIKSIKSVI